MRRVTGIGGIFIKSANTQRMRDWYQKHLGIDIQQWGGAAFAWKGAENPEGVGTTVWNVFEASSSYFDPSKANFMVNYRVANLKRVLKELRAEGVAVADKVEESEYGKFSWIMDPEGNRLELWQPPAPKRKSTRATTASSCSRRPCSMCAMPTPISAAACHRATRP